MRGKGFRLCSVVVLGLLCAAVVCAGQRALAADDALATAQKLEEAFIRVAKQVEPSVVKVLVTRKVPVRVFNEGDLPDWFDWPPELRRFFPFPRFPGEEQAPKKRQPQETEPTSVGSGFVIAEGWIATNSHVVDGAESVWIEVADGRRIEIKKRLVDKLSDCAFLQFDPTLVKLRPLPLGDSDKVEVGSIAIAIGNPFSLGISFNVGVVSGLGRSIGAPLTDEEGRPIRRIPGLIQTDAAINPGNSGGPLVNLRGEVIGMNTAIYNRALGSEGIGWAIPSNLVKKIFNILREKGKVERGWLGVALEEKTREELQALGAPNGGAYVSQITPGGPAEKSDLAPGDIIIAFDPTPGTGNDTVAIRSNQDLIDAVEFTAPGTEVELTVIRLNEQKKVRVKLGTFPLRWGAGMRPLLGGEGPAGNILGLSVGPLSDKRRRAMRIPQGVGLEVTAVDEGGVAERVGIQPGDALVAIDQTLLHTVDDFNKAVDALAGKRTCMLRWIHMENGVITAQARQVLLPEEGAGE